MNSRSVRALLGFSLMFGALVLAGCPQGTTIADINRDPSRYAGKEVTILGNVVDSFGALGQGAYQMDDGTGRIWVISEGFGVPSNGARVRVTGRVSTGVTLGSRSFGTVLRETQRRKNLGG